MPEEFKAEKLLYKPSEAFAATGICRSIGYQLIQSGEWPHIKVGKSIRIPVDGLRDWMKQKLNEQSGNGQ